MKCGAKIQDPGTKCYYYNLLWWQDHVIHTADQSKLNVIVTQREICYISKKWDFGSMSYSPPKWNSLYQLTLMSPGMISARCGSITSLLFCSTNFVSILIAPWFTGYSPVVMSGLSTRITTSGGSTVPIVAAHASALLSTCHNTKDTKYILKHKMKLFC